MLFSKLQREMKREHTK